MWRFGGIVSDVDDNGSAWERVVLGLDRMAPPDPTLGPRWFLGARLNFAENLLRFDDDRDASAPARELAERRPREREGERVSHGRGHLDDARRRRRRSQDDVVGSHRDGDDPRAREDRHACHGTADDTVAS